MPTKTTDPLIEITHALLAEIEPNPNRPDLRETPTRVAKMLREVTGGYQQDISKILKDGIFTGAFKQQVEIRDIEFYSLCEHHLLPFFGKCHLLYQPNKKIIGLSKVPRIVQAFSQRLQVQERLTDEIADALFAALKPKYLEFSMEAKHLCMMMRGVKDGSGVIRTTTRRGKST